MSTRFARRLRASLATTMVLVAKAAFAADVADLILVDASVVTMDRAVPRAQAIAVKDGLILAVGSIEQVLALKGDATRVRDLDGSVVMPGFVDPQGSCAAAGLAASAADLSGADAGDEQASRQMIERHAKEPVSRRLGVVLGAMNSPIPSFVTAEWLDQAVRDLPAIVMVDSGRTIVLNSKARELAGVEASGSATLDNADASRAMAAIVASRSSEALAELMLAGQQLLAARGYTTVAEVGVDETRHAALVRLAAARRMVVDVVAFADGHSTAASPPAGLSSPWKSPSATNGYRVAGISVAFDRELVDTLDGQASGPSNGVTLEPSRRRDVVAAAFDNGWQLMVDAHGPEAIGSFVEVILEVSASKGPSDRRPILVGADVATSEHFASLLEPRVGVAFGPGRIALDGDRLRDATPEVADAERLSSAATALFHRVPVGFHSSVGWSDPLRVAQAASGRRTASGDILGPRERVTVEQALRGVTLDASYLIGEDARKGSIEPGKLADLVILSGDPLAVGADGPQDLRVIETVKSGRTVHQDNGSGHPLLRRPGAAWVTGP
jgi:predicted amidohydrolase YtcJ